MYNTVPWHVLNTSGSLRVNAEELALFNPVRPKSEILTSPDFLINIFAGFLYAS
jgi:hypothetical protein